MGEHTEWVRARDAFIEYEEHHDSFGTDSQGPALLIGNDSVVAIEGTPAELQAFLTHCQEAISEALLPSGLGRRPSHSQKVRILAERYRPWNDAIEDWLKAVDEGNDEGGWLLVEKSNITGDHEFSLHEDLEAAMGYSAEQECAEDWDPVAAYDLDGGIRHALRRGFTTELDEYEGTTEVKW